MCWYIWVIPWTLVFCDLDLQFQGHWQPLKCQISAIFSHFGPLFIYRKLIILWVVYIIHIYVPCKHAEIWPWSSSLKVIHRRPKYLNEAIFGLFGDIFTLNADYIASFPQGHLRPDKWLKMVPFTVYICLFKTVKPYTSFIIVSTRGRLVDTFV